MERDAQTGSHIEAVALNAEGLVERVQNLLCYLNGTALSRAGQEDSELVATQPGNAVGFSQRGAQSRPELLQEQIAVMVPEGVVDLFEAIKIHEQQGNRCVAALRRQNGLSQSVV